PRKPLVGAAVAIGEPDQLADHVAIGDGAAARGLAWPPALLAEGRPEPLGEVAAIEAANLGIGDPGEELPDGVVEARAALGRVAGLGLGQMALPQLFDQRPRTGETLANRPDPLLANQRVRVLALGERQEAERLAGRQERERPIGGAAGGPL